MAVGSLPTSGAALPQSVSRRKDAEDSLPWRILEALGSLKITVVMFICAIFILFVGTLAQDEMNLPEVKRVYFNSWIARIAISDFLPITIFGERNIPGSFPFLGGATIGFVLLINLIAAKATRFHIEATGSRLLWGSAVTLLGSLMTLGVILTGNYSQGLQGNPPISYGTLWILLKLLIAVFFAGFLATALTQTKVQPLVKWLLWLMVATFGITAGLVFFGGDRFRLGDPSLRIVWQLMQSSLAGLVLLVGLVMVFGRRGGNVLIHLAVGLVMFGQFAFGDRQIEQRMSLVEGQSTNMVFRTDEVELAVIDAKDPVNDRVTVISDKALQRAKSSNKKIQSEDLPFDILVKEYFVNSDLQPAANFKGENLATTGEGKQWVAVPIALQGGVSDRQNIASAYVELFEKGTETSLGTYLVSQIRNDQAQIFMAMEPDLLEKVDTKDGSVSLQLRFRREYKPYSVSLTDVRRINYSASFTPRDYSSFVTFNDPDKGTEEGRIWMNNPVRYQGETFYQSQYSKIPVGNGQLTEMTGLQVVENSGWLIPYVACVLAFWGMLTHFGGTFLRFADRRERMLQQQVAAEVAVKPKRSYVPLIVTTLLVLMVASRAYQRPAKVSEFDWQSAGKLPAMHEGRIKPLDTIARNMLQALGNRTSVSIPDPEASEWSKMFGFDSKRLSAVQWLFGAWSGEPWVDEAPIFRIDAREVLDLFDLKPREGHRYSYSELKPHLDKLQAEMEKLRNVPEDSFDFRQKKLAEINQKVMIFNLLQFSYQTPQLPQMSDDPKARDEFFNRLPQILRIARQLEQSLPPAAIPPQGEIDVMQDDSERKEKWQAVYPAVANAFMSSLDSMSNPDQPRFKPNPAILGFVDLINASSKSPREFEKALKEYHQIIDKYPTVIESESKANFESWFNHFGPIDLAKWLYVLCGVICFAGFLGYYEITRKTTFWMLAAILVLHTCALAGRIYLTGKPPVVNLYSSAVFIGWFCVIAGLVIETLIKRSVGNLVASLAGAATLMVAYGLDTGDTMHVLQAVLDTQFWLSTHVITVALGYAATFLAGILAIVALAHRIAKKYDQYTPDNRPAALKQEQDELYRMTYGVVCFALFFSFIGTVLGGLWADDSWGRFWGWDPKENGALMIVLWNAAVLHARWDRWVGQRGFALLAIVGNIVTAWSWFGTNQLGIGLHSYGFTSGVLMLLGGFVLSQILLAIAAWFLTRPSPVEVDPATE